MTELQPMRVILDRIPAMLRDTIKEIITTDARGSIVAETDSESGLRTTLEQSRADVIIVASHSDVADADRYVELLRAYPAIRVLAIASDGRRAFMHELRHSVTEIAELSPQTLLTALRSPK